MDRPKRPPPVPKFEDKRDQTDLEKKLDSFINQISQTQSHPTASIEHKTNSIINLTPSPTSSIQPAVKPQPVKEQAGKKKFALASLNSKLNNMLSTKKINVNSALSSEMQKEKHEQKKPTEVEYDYQHPNSYQLIKQNYASHFATLAQSDSDSQSIEQKQPEQQMEQQYQPQEKEQIALRMMQKFGYKVGEGLGKQSQGIRTPLIVRKTTDSAGIIELSSIPLNYLITREVSAKNALAAHGIEVSQVVTLVGTLTMQELEQGLQEQIRRECCIHGVVCDWLLFLVGEQLRIFVQFQTKEQALHAFAQMNGKYFGEKLVSLRFYPTQLFRERQLNQQTHPHIPL